MPGAETAVLVAPKGCFERMPLELQAIDAQGKTNVEVLAVELVRLGDGRYLLDVSRDVHEATRHSRLTPDAPALPAPKAATAARFGEAAMARIEVEAVEDIKRSKAGTRSIVVLRNPLPLSADTKEVQRACHALCSRTDDIQVLRQSLVIAGETSAEHAEPGDGENADIEDLEENLGKG